jgi:hypothetical protein
MRETRRLPRVTSRTRLAGALMGGVLALALILAVSHGNVDRMTYGDGEFYRYVAEHMDARPANLDPLVAARGPAMRYGRITLPAAIWIFSAGEPEAMRYVQPAVMVIAGAAIAAMTTELLPGLGLGAALLPFFALGLSLSLSGGYAEPVAAAFGLAAILAARRRRWIAAAACLALAMLTRESAFVFLLGLGLWGLTKREWRGLVILGVSAVPVVAWHLVVAARFGHLPLWDPYTKEIGLRAAPFTSVGKALMDFPANVVLVAALHLGLAVVAITFWRRSALGAVTAGTAFQIVFFPLLTWHYLGDAFRTFTFLELMTILALAAWWKRADIAEPDGVPS